MWVVAANGATATVIAEIAAVSDRADTDGGWRTRLRQRFLAARQVMLRWAPGLLH
jgi:hypothetical protein